jgi:hypothetical protein
VVALKALDRLLHQPLAGVVALRQVLDETRSPSCLAGGFHLAQRHEVIYIKTGILNLRHLRT